MADIKLTDEQWSGIVGAAVLQAVTPENRDTLIKEALANLLTPKSVGGYGSRATSPLQDAFSQAMHRHAYEEISRLLKEDPEIIANLQAVIRTAIVKMLENEEVIGGFAKVAVSAFEKSLSNY